MLHAIMKSKERVIIFHQIYQKLSLEQKLCQFCIFYEGHYFRRIQPLWDVQFPGGNGVAKKDVKSGNVGKQGGDSPHTIFPFVDKVVLVLTFGPFLRTMLRD